MVERWNLMAINIKNFEVETRIRELALMRGISLVTAVNEAVEREIKNEKETQRKKKLMAEWLMKLSRETGPMMNDGKTSKELMDELYDPETGLPV
jgi:antitoxin VapB